MMPTKAPSVAYEHDLRNTRLGARAARSYVFLREVFTRDTLNILLMPIGMRATDNPFQLSERIAEEASRIDALAAETNWPFHSSILGEKAKCGRCTFPHYALAVPEQRDVLGGDGEAICVDCAREIVEKTALMYAIAIRNKYPQTKPFFDKAFAEVGYKLPENDA